MAKKEKTEDTTDQGIDEKNPDSTYRAYLEVGGVRIATITMRAKDDADAKEQLERSRPTYFEGVGDWSLIKVTNQPVSLE